MTKEETKLRLLTDFKLYSEYCLKIKTKKGTLSPFALNKAQIKVNEIYNKAAQFNKPLRFIVLKARQEGISTYFEGRIFLRTANQKNRKAVIIGHKSDASDNLFGMFTTFYKHLPQQMKPSTKYSSKKEIVFGELNSSIEVDTAENGEGVGRSGTIQDLHATEVAFWRDAATTMLALLQTIPDEPNTLVVVESTANGIGGWFYDTWQDAVEGKNDFIPIFLSWFDLDEYTKPFENDEDKQKLIGDLSEYEVQLKEKFNLTYEQLNWRRYIIANKCNHSEDQFNQEYPATPEEAFIASGRPVFNAKMIISKLNTCVGPEKYGDLVYIYKNEKIVGVDFIENPKGFIKLHKQIGADVNAISEHNRFCSGWDIAEGLEQGDYTDGFVYDRKFNEIVMSWHGHLPPDMVAEEQDKINRYLNFVSNVCFATEKNNHGLTTITNAYNLGLWQYHRQEYQSGAFPESKADYGFITNAKTKPYIINQLDEWLRDNLFFCNDKEFFKQCLTFVRNEKGQMQAQGKDKDAATKCYDDAVMAMAITIEVHRWMPNYYAIYEKRDTPKSFRTNRNVQLKEGYIF